VVQRFAMADRLLLRRSGSAYVFVHQLLAATLLS
jgi:hypothetical protein